MSRSLAFTAATSHKQSTKLVLLRYLKSNLAGIGPVARSLFVSGFSMGCPRVTRSCDKFYDGRALRFVVGTFQDRFVVFLAPLLESTIKRVRRTSLALSASIKVDISSVGRSCTSLGIQVSVFGDFHNRHTRSRSSMRRLASISFCMLKLASYLEDRINRNCKETVD